MVVYCCAQLAIVDRSVTKTLCDTILRHGSDTVVVVVEVNAMESVCRSAQSPDPREARLVEVESGA